LSNPSQVIQPKQASYTQGTYGQNCAQASGTALVAPPWAPDATLQGVIRQNSFHEANFATIRLICRALTRQWPIWLTVISLRSRQLPWHTTVLPSSLRKIAERFI